MTTHHYGAGDRHYAVTLERTDGVLRAVIREGEREMVYTLTAERIGPGAWLLDDGTRHRVHVAPLGPDVQVHVDGVTTVLARETPRRSRAAGSVADAPDAVTAPMTGSVRAVLVTAGDAVEHGQALLILEAMKMEVRVTALADGIVTAIFAQPGDVVQRGQALVALGPVPAG